MCKSVNEAYVVEAFYIMCYKPVRQTAVTLMELRVLTMTPAFKLTPRLGCICIKQSPICFYSFMVPGFVCYCER